MTLDGLRFTSLPCIAQARELWEPYFSVPQAVFATFIVSAIGLLAATCNRQFCGRVVPRRADSTLFVSSQGVLISIVMELVIKQERVQMFERACKEIDKEFRRYS